ncbi:MAG: hypothetical protein HY244_16940 [Rhizobiales bacterium]|nr:hypothetical protein [Hyphomicrobiales bacterium]
MIARVAFASLLLAMVNGAAWAQQSVRVAGTVASFDGRVLAINSAKLGEVKINLTDNVAVFGVAKATLADIKPGAFIGVGAIPQTDGSQRAIQVTIFAEVQRGQGEGHRPWDARPNSTMTNATVEQTVAGVGGQVVMVKYKDGEKKIVVPPDAVILAYAVGDKTELKPGAQVAIIRAMKKPDDSLEANRVNVGRGGMVPQ